MTMTRYVNGPRQSVQYVPGSTVNAGDVIVIGGIPMIADVDNPIGAGLSLTQMALYCGGGIYQIPADAAYAVGQQVFWDTVKQQVTALVSANTYSFGYIVAGPLGLASDGGPTGAASLAFVEHAPRTKVVYETGTVAATGTTQGGAAVLAEGFNLVTGGSGTAGVILPAATPGTTVRVKNNGSGGAVLVYPPVGCTINALAANTNYNVANEDVSEFLCYSATAWYTFPYVAS